ncbi:uncharacterized protein LOC113769353 [Coffea eugenioides]|uniref:uncharacterized protein LOC113769353 n=1 Tax=Coffea eugenioides TaxID=49369 RepID=UPI000F60B9F5|nr:uncharacterized protein LOC113769353 [Coffea eugenioides]
MDNMKQATSGKYLGLPMTIGRTKNLVFGNIKCKVNSKLQRWKQKLLSQGGKEVLVKAVIMAMPSYAVLVKAVIMAMPSYAMSCFRLPKGLCKDISRKVANFWWRSEDNRRKVHWAS